MLKIKIPRPHPKLSESESLEEGLGMPVYMPQVILVIRQVQPMLRKCCCALHNNAQWQEDHPHEQNVSTTPGTELRLWRETNLSVNLGSMASSCVIVGM